MCHPFLQRNQGDLDSREKVRMFLGKGPESVSCCSLLPSFYVAGLAHPSGVGAGAGLGVGTS